MKKEARNFEIRSARMADIPIILELIRALAAYERAPNDVTATEDQLVDVLFGKKPAAEVLLALKMKLRLGSRCSSTMALFAVARKPAGASHD